jgi:WD40 repeat protein
VWDVPGRRLLGTVDLPPAGDDFHYRPFAWVSPDGAEGATVRDDSGVIVFSTATRSVVRKLAPLPASPSQFAVSVQGWTPDGSGVLVSRQSTVADSEVFVIDARTGAVRLRIPVAATWPDEVAADPTGRYLAMALDDGTLLVVDARDGHALAPPLRANDGYVANVSISPDGRYIATSGGPPRALIWDSRTFRPVGTPLPLDIGAKDSRVRFARDGTLIVTSGPVMRQYPVDPDQWLRRACREAGRTLTRAELEQYLPGRPYQPACS